MIGYTLEEAFEALGMSKYAETMLRGCYEQSHRKYHNLGHLRDMLSHVPRSIMGVETILEAILYHDIVYLAEPTPPGFNEALSAAEYLLYAMRVIGSHPNPFANSELNLIHEINVIEAINASSRHTEDQENLKVFSHYVLDLDLCSLADKEHFTRASKLIREEYSHVDEIAFAEGRRAFLKALISRKAIFYVMKEWEASARLNLQDEISLLTDKLEGKDHA